MHDRKLTQSIDVFDSQERERLAADEQLSIYRDLTTDHVMGLLDAWANYLIRRIGSEPQQVGWQSLPAPPQVGAAHRDLVELGRRLYLEGQRAPNQDDEYVFSEAERENLRLYKYTRGSEHLTHRQLLDLLRAVRAYTAVATMQPLMTDQMTMFNRGIHAHNWVVRFGQEPFTDEEYVKDLHDTVLSKRYKTASN